MGQYMKDFSSASLAAQAKFGESAAFRAICGNVKASWTDRAGFMCNVESSNTFKNVTVDIPQKFIGLSVLGPHVLSALLNFNFRMLDELVDYQETTKKIDFFHFGHFLVKGESLRSVSFLAIVVKRMFAVLGCVGGLKSAWKEIGVPLTEVLSVGEEKSVANWSAVYVVKKVSHLFMRLGWFLAQSGTSVLTGDAFISATQVVLAFDYASELPLYLASPEYTAKLSSKPWTPNPPKVLGGGHRNTWQELKKGGKENPQATKEVDRFTTNEGNWCVAAASHSLGVQSTDCAHGKNCRFTHPKLGTKPFSPKVKESLTQLSKIIRNEEVKGKFVAAFM